MQPWQRRQAKLLRHQATNDSMGRRVDENLLLQLLTGAQAVVPAAERTAAIDCRAFSDPHSDSTLHCHVGFHPDILRSTSKCARILRELFTKVRAAIVAARSPESELPSSSLSGGGRRPAVIVICYRRCGNHRSVPLLSCFSICVAGQPPGRPHRAKRHYRDVWPKENAAARAALFRFAAASRGSSKPRRQSPLQSRVGSPARHRSVLQVSYKSVPQECPARVSYKSVPQECTVSHKGFGPECVLQEFPARMSDKSVLQECLTRVRECPTRVSRKSVAQEPTKVSHKSVLQDRLQSDESVARECPTGGVLQERLLQKCPRMFGRLFSSTCLHSGSLVSILSLSRKPNLLRAESRKPLPQVT